MTNLHDPGTCSSPEILANTGTSQSCPNRLKEVFAGSRATIPMIVGAIPFGIIFGTLAEQSGLSPLGAIAMSVFVFAGSSQFIALGLLSAGTGPLIIIATTFIVNLRHLLYSAAIVDDVKHLPGFWRALIAFGLTDESFAILADKIRKSDENWRLGSLQWFYLGSFLAMYCNWILCTVIGITLGELFPQMNSWGLDFAMSATFIGMVLPYLTTRPMLACVLVAGAMSLGTADLPHQLGLMVSAISAIAVGLSFHLACRRKEKTAVPEGMSTEDIKTNEENK
ncbi:AzlC family ABC transporter permease [Kiloniella laminariae]|uniref:AzlC family ABC transporter permease n=1 Tax=Kiloniella laminariae TaxID=454162 RepID=A0ABT4LMF2_9PROT|nr:AzlC family ABC transporter permease [Kiloniella laminariae]MCZ4281551.1 AzlC family ABC transporter permease [Kiloniella laminariae]